MKNEENVPIKENETVNKHWYRVKVPSSHAPRKGERHDIFVMASDAVDALDMAQHLRGWKRHIGTNRFPDIHEVPSSEIPNLLTRIKDSGIPMEKIIREGFYGKRKLVSNKLPR